MVLEEQLTGINQKDQRKRKSIFRYSSDPRFQVVNRVLVFSFGNEAQQTICERL